MTVPFVWLAGSASGKLAFLFRFSPFLSFHRRDKRTQTNMEKDEFAGKTVIVTGSGAGLGRAISRAFAREGANVVVVDLDAEAGAPHLFAPRH
jgi:2-polyprenyl-3-methyl-5-hydroxy-6-metoxy-1,4-benzoquinol methylase